MPFRCSVIPLSVLVLSLGGCGGGSSSGSSSHILSGQIADGYIKGAVVCLDRNDNLQCDADEPQTVSGDEGRFSILNITTDEAARFRIVAEVPAGAIDADMPDEPISKPYFMTAPIGMHGLLTPVSTLITEEMRQYPYLSTDQAADIMAARLQIAPADIWYDYNKTLKKQDLLLHAINNTAANRLAGDLEKLKNDPAAAVYSQKEWRQLAAGRTLQVLNNSQAVLRVALAYTTTKGPWSITNPLVDTTKPLSDALALYRRQPEVISGFDLITSGPFFDPGFIYPEACTASLHYDCTGSFPARQFSYRSIAYAVADGLVTPVIENHLYDPVTQSSTPAPAAVTPKILYLNEDGWTDKSPMQTPTPTSRFTNGRAVFTDLSNLPVSSVLMSLATQIDRTRNLPAMYFPAGTTFPAGSRMMRSFSSNEADTYLLSDQTLNNTTFDYPYFKDESDAFMSLDELISHFAGNTANTIYLESYTDSENGLPSNQYTMQFGPDHTLLLELKTLDPSGAVIGKTEFPGGTWDDLNIHGQRVLRINRPLTAPDSTNSSLIYAEIGGKVVYGRFYPKGAKQELLMLNSTAMNALKAAYRP